MFSRSGVIGGDVDTQWGGATLANETVIGQLMFPGDAVVAMRRVRGVLYGSLSTTGLINLPQLTIRLRWGATVSGATPPVFGIETGGLMLPLYSGLTLTGNLDKAFFKVNFVVTGQNSSNRQFVEVETVDHFMGLTIITSRPARTGYTTLNATAPHLLCITAQLATGVLSNATLYRDNLAFEAVG